MRESRWILFLLLVGLLGSWVCGLGQASWPNCRFNCTAQDVVLVGAYIDVSGGTCAPGSNVTATLKGVFDANATRYAVWLLADVYVNGSVVRHLNECVAGSISTSGGTFTLATFSWPCGATLELRNVVVSWTASETSCSDEPLCTDRQAKCYSPSVGSVSVATPLIADFSSDAPQCLGQPIAFTSLVSGGTAPYSYQWDLGDGSSIDTRSAPAHIYTAAGTYTVQLTVRDRGGQTVTRSHSVTVTALPSPTASNDGPVCPGMMLHLSANGGVSYAWSGPAGFTSNLQNPSIAPATASASGTYVVTVTSAAGCSASASTVVVVDTTPPDLTAPPNLTISCGHSTLPSATGQASATDNLSTPTITYSDKESLTDCGGTGSILRTWTATDACGNSSSAFQTITVADSSAPTLTLPPDIVVPCGHSLLPAATGQATAIDDCSTPEVTYSDQSSLTDCGGTGIILRTWTATDACGHSTEGVQTLTVIDTSAPALTLPPDVTVQCGHSTLPAATGRATAVDGCSIPEVTYSDDVSLTGCGGTGTIKRTWTATDACGNSASAIQTITVTDASAPALTLPPDATVECGHSTLPTATGQATAADGCSTPDVTYSDSVSLSGCGGTGTIERTWTATDACGNSASAIQTITVTDTTAPSLTIPPDETLEPGQSTEPSSTGSASAIDTCSAASITHVDQTDLSVLDGSGTILRTWTATDACGNSVSAVQTITVAEVQRPELSLTPPADVTVQSGEPVTPTATGTPSITTTCPTAPSITYQDEADLSGCDGTGQILRTWTAEDACGNTASGVQTITVIDTASPSLVIPADVTVQSGEPTDPSATGHASAFDPDAEEDEPLLVTYSDEADLSGCDGTGTIERTWTAEDACGNTTSGVQTITVIDTASPSLVIPADVTVQSGEPTDPSATGYASAFDPDAEEDEPLLVTYSDEADLSGCDGTGQILRTWTAEDACGNTTSGVQTITVIDTAMPNLIIPADVTVQSGEPTDPSATGYASAFDPDAEEDEPLLVTYSDEADLSGCSGTGVILRTWTAADACGNTADGIQRIDVVDTIPPVLLLPNDINVECGTSLDPAVTGQATASHPNGDSLDPITVTSRDLESLSNCDGSGSVFRRWTATDTCGNSTNDVQVISVVGSCTAPVVISEVAWAGTKANPNHEWIELRNLGDSPVNLDGWILRWRLAKAVTAEEGRWNTVPLSGILAPAAPPTRFTLRDSGTGIDFGWFNLDTEAYRQDFLVVERESDNTLPDLPAAVVYGASDSTAGALDLSDAGDYIELVSASGCVVDTANASRIGLGGWLAGDAESYGSMERTDPLVEDRSDNWHTNLGVVTFGVDADGTPLSATPGAENEPVLDTLVRTFAAAPPLALSASVPLTLTLPADAPPDTGDPAHVVVLPSVGETPLDLPLRAERLGAAVEVVAGSTPVGAESYSVWIRIGQTVLYLPIVVAQ